MTPTAEPPGARTSDLDPTARALLPILRHVLVTFARPESQAWRLAFSAARHAWGEARGLALAYQVQSLVVALNAGRVRSFRFNDPLDPIDRDRLTPDEVALLELLGALNCGDDLAAHGALARVMRGRVDARVMAAAQDLAQMLDPMAGQYGRGNAEIGDAGQGQPRPPRSPGRRPALRLVC